MNIRSTVTSAVAAVAWCAATVAHAAPTTTLIGNATILGTDYTVSVLFDSSGDNSFNDLAPSITFHTEADALAAGQVLLDTFGIAPFTIAGAGTRIAYDFDSTQYGYVTVTDCCGPADVFGPFARSVTETNTFSFAQFTVSAVPEPESALMLMAGLGVLGWARRRRD